jgi:hypothetical protein
VDSVSNTINWAVTRMLRATLLCAAILGPAAAQAQQVGATGGALGGAFFNGASLGARSTPDAVGTIKTGSDPFQALTPATTGNDAPPRVLPFYDGGYGHRRPAVGLDFSFDLGAVDSLSRDSIAPLA